MSEEFTPRIVVTDDMDAEIVFAALVGYIHGLTARLAMVQSVEMDTIDAMRRATDLCAILGEEIQSANVRRVAGEIPDDLSALDTENGD